MRFEHSEIWLLKSLALSSDNSSTIVTRFLAFIFSGGLSEILRSEFEFSRSRTAGVIIYF